MWFRNQFSTHGFRRTAITSLHKNNIPVKLSVLFQGIGVYQHYKDILIYPQKKWLLLYKHDGKIKENIKAFTQNGKSVYQLSCLQTKK